MEKLLDRLKELTVGNVLDIATGRGEFIDFLKQTVKDYDNFIGIDQSERMIEAANIKEEEKIDMQIMDAYKLDYPDGAFDSVAISNSLHHFDKPEAIIKEMDRVLRKGGYYLISEMISDETQIPAQLNHVKLHHWWAEIDREFGVSHNRTYSREELKKLMVLTDNVLHEFFEYAYPMPEEQSKQYAEKLAGMMDTSLGRVKGKESFDNLKLQCETIKKSLKQHGYAPATQVFFLGKK